MQGIIFLTQNNEGLIKMKKYLKLIKRFMTDDILEEFVCQENRGTDKFPI